MSSPPEPKCDVWLCSGRLYFSRAAHETVLASCPAVALLNRSDAWLLLPLLAGAGGLQVKQRNARGDRVVEAQEFFRGQGLEDSPQVRPMVLHDAPATGGYELVFDQGTR